MALREHLETLALISLMDHHCKRKTVWYADAEPPREKKDDAAVEREKDVVKSLSVAAAAVAAAAATRRDKPNTTDATSGALQVQADSSYSSGDSSTGECHQQPKMEEERQRPTEKPQVPPKPRTLSLKSVPGSIVLPSNVVRKTSSQQTTTVKQTQEPRRKMGSHHGRL